MRPRTDLAVEKLEEIKFGRGGTQNESYYAAPVTFTKTRILTQKAAARIGKPIGNYLTAKLPDLSKIRENYPEISETLAKEIRAILPKKYGTVLVYGLGNRDITPDALGPKTAENIIATRHIPEIAANNTGFGALKRVAALSPGVLGQTGLEAGEIILGIAQKIKPDFILVIDALAANNPANLGNTLQFTDTGIVPGSGVGGAGFEISTYTLGIPVISAGLTTVINSKTFGSEGEMIVTPANIDELITNGAKLLSLTLNKAIHGAKAVEALGIKS